MGKKRLEALFEQNRELDAQIARTNTAIALYRELLEVTQGKLAALYASSTHEKN